MKALSSIDTNALQSEMAVEKSYSLKEAADLLNVSVSGLRNWIRDDKIESFKVGEKLIRIKESEINRVLGTSQNIARTFKEDLLSALDDPEISQKIRSIVKKK